jgi:hypothetical protein
LADKIIVTLKKHIMALFGTSVKEDSFIRQLKLQAEKKL